MEVFGLDPAAAYIVTMERQPLILKQIIIPKLSVIKFSALKEQVL
jgi:hypothetical protein